MSEPAFWAGFDRGSVDGFRDYFRQLTEFEPKRAGWYRIQHFTWLCINAKEAENVSLSREVIAMIPEFLDKPGVLGIGEIGLNKNTRNEVDHLPGARRSGDEDERADPDPHAPLGRQVQRDADDPRHALRRLAGIDHSRVLVDHVEEHTIRHVLDAGFWAGMTLYPVSKCTPQRAVDMVEMYGPERLLVNSAGDWGPSKPTAVPDFIMAMRLRGHPESLIRRIVYENPLEFFSQSRGFQFTPPELPEAAEL